MTAPNPTGVWTPGITMLGLFVREVCAQLSALLVVIVVASMDGPDGEGTTIAAVLSTLCVLVTFNSVGAVGTPDSTRFGGVPLVCLLVIVAGGVVVVVVVVVFVVEDRDCDGVGPYVAVGDDDDDDDEVVVLRVDVDVVDDDRDVFVSDDDNDDNVDVRDDERDDEDNVVDDALPGDDVDDAASAVVMPSVVVFRARDGLLVVVEDGVVLCELTVVFTAADGGGVCRESVVVDGGGVSLSDTEVLADVVEETAEMDEMTTGDEEDVGIDEFVADENTGSTTSRRIT